MVYAYVNLFNCNQYWLLFSFAIHTDFPLLNFFFKDHAVRA